MKKSLFFFSTIMFFFAINLHSQVLALDVEGNAVSGQKDDVARFQLDNDSESFLMFKNSTFNDSYFVPDISGYTGLHNQPGLVIRGLADVSNDINSHALLHITPQIIDGEDQRYPVNRHYLGIQGFDTYFGQKSLFEIDEEGDVGIGTDDPKAKLHIEDGDIYLDDINSGVIMRSSNGQCWKGLIDNTGNLIFSSISCP